MVYGSKKVDQSVSSSKETEESEEIVVDTVGVRETDMNDDGNGSKKVDQSVSSSKEMEESEEIVGDTVGETETDMNDDDDDDVSVVVDVGNDLGDV